MIRAPSVQYYHVLIEELTMEIKERLSKISKTVYLKDVSDLTDLSLFYEVYEDILIHCGQRMQEFSTDLLGTLLSILKLFDVSAQESVSSCSEQIQKLAETINNLSASFPEPEDGNQSFVKFLWTLRCGDELFAEQNILLNYDKYIDHMESLSWLFQLELDGHPVYPISNLLNDRILREFNPDSEEDLLYLIASLQLFNQLKNIPDDRRHTVLELSRRYNLKILEMLCDNGQLLFGRSRKLNMDKNKIMGVRCGDTILIRTTDLSRKAPPGISFQSETNRETKEIARFFTYDLGPDCELCSLDAFFRNSSPEQCMTVFLNCLENEVYNAFMEDSLIYSGNNHTFVGWVNPIVSDDPFIVSNDSFQKADSGENQFFAHLDDRTLWWLRPARLVKSGIDQLTLDYMIGFYDNVCKPMNVSARSILCEKTSVWQQEFSQRGDQFAQNLVVKSFFAHILNHNLDIAKAIMSYSDFITKYYSSYGEITADTRLVFPYAFYFPFKDEEELLNAMLKSKGENIGTCRQVTLTCKMFQGWQIDGFSGNYTYLDISTLDEPPMNPTPASFTGLLDEISKKVYILFSPADKGVITAFGRLKMHLEVPVITENNRNNYTAFLRRRPLEKLVYDIGIPRELKKLFWPGAEANGLALGQLSPLLLFKILHHINVYRITAEKLDDWGKLIFDCHLVAPSSSSDEMYESFRNGVNSRNKDRNCLMISKRSYADKSTLGALLNNTKERFATDSAFDPGALNQRIGFKEDTNQYYFTENGNWKQKITSIVFLTDNIISGDTTFKMLAYHFSGQSIDAPSSNYYVKLEEGKTVRKIMDTNDPQIELHTVFWFSDLQGCTVHEKKGELYPVDFQVNEIERIKFFVRAYQTYRKDDYLYTKEAFELAKNIYGETNVPEHHGESESRHLVFRFNNMPGFSVFPKEVRKIWNKVGLFERRK